jgi:hypothetical protein
MTNPETEIKKIKEKSTWSSKLIFFSIFFKKTNTLIVIVAFLLFSYCVFIWYKTLYHPDWTQSQKEEYMKSKNKGTVFNKNGFEAVVDEFDARKAELAKDLDIPVDIFRLKN